MALAPEIVIHATAAIGAILTGPVALWARKGRQQQGGRRQTGRPEDRVERAATRRDANR